MLKIFNETQKCYKILLTKAFIGVIMYTYFTTLHSKGAAATFWF